MSAASATASAPGRLIAFEGVDGAGKSSVVAAVAEALSARGEPVFLPRMGKEHASRPTRQIRSLTRDRRNLELHPRAELLLYCAREAQILEELVRPALARGQTVLIDRSLLTPAVLGRARGLEPEACDRAAHAAAQGTEPELTLVFDVHPRTSRIRKRIERIRAHTLGDGGRKGLAGSAFKERIRRGYQQLARERGYPLFHVERATPGQLAERVLAVIDHGGRAPVAEDERDRTPQWLVPEDWGLATALDSVPLPVALFLSNGLISARELRQRAQDQEPQLAAWAMDPEDPLRERIAEAEPDYALRAWRRRPLSGPDDLRLRLLDKAPAACIAALKHLGDAESDALRERYAEREPDAVLTSLTGREDPFAERMRERCWPEARDETRATSLGFCRSERAWRRREKLMDKNPALGLSTLRGLSDPRGDAWLARYRDLAPKRVLAALGGRSDAFAYETREALYATGREVIDSVRGLGDERAWALRERALEAWPSTVAHSLLGLQQTSRARRMAERCRQLAGGDMHVLRRLQRLDERPCWPAWARARTGDTLADMEMFDD